MSTLLELVMQYGDARADWAVDKSYNNVPEALDAAKRRIEAIYDAVITIDIDGDKIKALLDGDES